MRSWKPRRKMPLEEQVWLLSTVEVFDPLSAEELEEIAQRAPDKYPQKGEIFFTPEDRGENLIVLKRGRVQVYELDNEGRELTLSVAEGGTVLGEMVLTGQRLYSVYVKALEPSVVCFLKRKDLEHIILMNSEVGLRMVRLLSERLQETELRLAEVVYKDVPARLARLIYRLVEREGVVTREDYKIPTHYTHEQLATMVGAKRVPVTKAFTRLREEGVVELRHREIHVTDLDALKDAAEVNGGVPRNARK